MQEKEEEEEALDNSSVADKSDDSSNAEEELVEDEDFEDDNLDNDSVSVEKVIMLYEKIESSQYQNEIDIEQLRALELEAEKNWTELHEKEEMLKTCKLENQELKKEIAVKKKFVFRMQQLFEEFLE